MSTMITLSADLRQVKGRGASRRLRKQQTVPGIVYGKTIEPINIQLEHKELLRASAFKDFYAHLINLKIDNQDYKVMVKDIQRHAYKNKLVHVDFQNIGADEMITFELPITFSNADTAQGVKQGGQLTISKKALTVRCQAKNIPESLEVDLANVEVNQILHISDIKLPEGVQSYDLMLGQDHDLAIASIHKANASVQDQDEQSDQTS